jgi:6-phosphogluconolactonase
MKTRHHRSTLRRLTAVHITALFAVTASGCNGAGLGSASSAGATASAAKTPAAMRVYIGTYTGGKSEGIYQMRLDMKSGKLSDPTLAAKVTNPSFLAIDPAGKHLYAVNEVPQFKEQNTGAVASFAIDAKTGGLTLLNQQSSKGAGPCHVAVDHAGKDVLVANYGAGNVAVLPIGKDGSLGEATGFNQHEGSSVDPARQKEPHAHSINVDPANRFVLSADLGLDKLLVYRFDADKGTIAPNDPPFGMVKPGSGPRHFAFDPSGKHVYVISEMGLTVTAFDYDAQRGALKSFQVISTLPAGVTDTKGMSTAEIEAHRSGKFLYGSNRGHDTIVIYTIDPKTGKLTYVGNESTQGKTPRNFAIDPTGTYLLAANQDSSTVVVFRIDQKTGKLTPTGQKVEVPKPVCVTFLPIGG